MGCEEYTSDDIPRLFTLLRNCMGPASVSVRVGSRYRLLNTVWLQWNSFAHMQQQFCGKWNWQRPLREHGYACRGSLSAGWRDDGLSNTYALDHELPGDIDCFADASSHQTGDAILGCGGRQPALAPGSSVATSSTPSASAVVHDGAGYSTSNSVVSEVKFSGDANALVAPNLEEDEFDKTVSTQPVVGAEAHWAARAAWDAEDYKRTGPSKARDAWCALAKIFDSNPYQVHSKNECDAWTVYVEQWMKVNEAMKLTHGSE